MPLTTPPSDGRVFWALSLHDAIENGRFLLFFFKVSKVGGCLALRRGGAGRTWEMVDTSDIKIIIIIN